jgi:hypothetical protein
MRRLVVIEGVTGAGKSRTIAALREWGMRAGQPVQVIDEDVTLGSFLDDVRTPAWQAQPAFPGLDAGLAALEAARRADPDALVLVERFHLSVYALFSRWRLLRRYDAALHALGAVHVLLDYHPRLTEQRSLLRPDRADWASGMDQHYGSRSLAIVAVKQSQARRRQALLLSELPYLHLDNSPGHWDDCAAAILAYCGYSADLPRSAG